MTSAGPAASDLERRVCCWTTSSRSPNRSHNFGVGAGVDSRSLEAGRRAWRKIGQPLLMVRGSWGTIGQAFGYDDATWKERFAVIER